MEVRQDFVRRPVFVPRLRQLTVEISERGAESGDDWALANVQRIVDASNATSAHRFTVLRTDDAIHVVPIGNDAAVLAADVQIQAGTITVADALDSILRTASHHAGLPVVVGLAPGARLSRRIWWEGARMTARDALTKLVVSLDRRMSWVSYYDFDTKQYYWSVFPAYTSSS